MLQQICTNRIIKDFHDIKKDNLEKHGIYHHFNDKNIKNHQFLIIGPDDTPYHNGFFFFDMTFPDDYPMSPPKVKYCTQGNQTRFNPNLYVSGKVCLSILNTWHGPSWSPCNSISSVLLSILSMVFTKEPIRNEPGYEEAKDRIVNVYNSIIEHETIAVATINIIKKIPQKFEYFEKIIKKHFITHSKWYINRCIELNKDYYGKTLKFGVYRLNVVCKYDTLLNSLMNIQNEIIKDVDNGTLDLYENDENSDNDSDTDSDDEDDNNEIDINNNQNTQSKKSKKSKKSNQSTQNVQNTQNNESNTDICIALLKNGNPCKYKKKNSEQYCGIHIKQYKTV